MINCFVFKKTIGKISLKNLFYNDAIRCLWKTINLSKTTKLFTPARGVYHIEFELAGNSLTYEFTQVECLSVTSCRY